MSDLSYPSNANDPNGPSVPRVVRGQQEPAEYRDPLIPMYRDNPLIEALPKIYTTAEAYQRLAYYPEYQDSQRALPSELRLHLIYNANQFLKPNWVHLELEQRLSRVLRAGYVARNPCGRGYWQSIATRVQSHPSHPVLPRWQSKPNGFNLVGISGIGKSTALEAILQLYPQVITHQAYHDAEFSFVQVVWLKLDCPFDGSLRGLCINFLQELDELLGTDYYKHYMRNGRASTDELLGRMKQLTALHGIGCLVIDEIQHLSVASNTGVSGMLNFFVQLVNTMGMPVVLVGTYKALPLLTGEFRQARRASGQGDFVWERMQPDEVWQMFVETLWRYQFTRQVSALTPELGQVLYEVSQGITDFAVKAYLLAQMRAIATGVEAVTPALLRSVAADSFRFAREVLEALRTNDWQKLSRVPDIQLVDLQTQYDHYQSSLRERNARATAAQATPHEASVSGEPGEPPPAPVSEKEKPATARPRGKKAAPVVAPAAATWPEGDLRQATPHTTAPGVTAYQTLGSLRYLKPASEFFERRRSA